MADSDLIRSERARGNWIQAGLEGCECGDRPPMGDRGGLLDLLHPRGTWLATWWHGALLQPETLATMLEPHYQPDTRVPGFGLGFYRANLGAMLPSSTQSYFPASTLRSSSQRRSRRDGLHQRGQERGGVADG
jgi:hypothetical protein